MTEKEWAAVQEGVCVCICAPFTFRHEGVDPDSGYPWGGLAVVGQPQSVVVLPSLWQLCGAVKGTAAARSSTVVGACTRSAFVRLPRSLATNKRSRTGRGAGTYGVCVCVWGGVMSPGKLFLCTVSPPLDLIPTVEYRVPIRSLEILCLRHNIGQARRGTL